jgi:hypothetical protein
MLSSPGHRSSFPVLALLCVALFGMPPRDVDAQASLDSLRTAVTVFGAASSGDALPFWLHANQHGTVDPASTNAGVRLQAHRRSAGASGLQYSVGVDVLARASQNATAHLHQLYGRLRYGPFQATAGRRTQTVGRVDTSLSLGGVTRSRNAPPLPRVSVSTDGYLAVPGTGNGLAFKGYLAHGWFGSDRFVEGALLHEKSLYARFLPPDFPVNAYAGIAHHAPWGGTHPQDGPQQSSLGRWWDVALGNEVLAEDRNEAQSDTFNPNHLAMYDFSLSADLGAVRGLAYRQFYHEDVASFNFRNVWDGLWGVSLRRNRPDTFVQAVLWEHLRMTRQSALFSAGESRGADSYYNHVHYRSGWTYQGRTLGTPLLTPAENVPGIGNNIVVAHHLALEGALGAGLTYRASGTYSRNYGAKRVCAAPDCTSFTDGRTERRDQYSVQVQVRGPLSEQHNLWFRTTAALDTGQLYDERVGLAAALTWRGL